MFVKNLTLASQKSTNKPEKISSHLFGIWKPPSTYVKPHPKPSGVRTRQIHSNRRPRAQMSAAVTREQWLILFLMAAINNRAPGWRDEARICSDRLAQVDGWQCEGINESTGPPTHGDESSADGLMSSLYGSVCAYVCVCVGLWSKMENGIREWLFPPDIYRENLEINDVKILKCSNI